MYWIGSYIPALFVQTGRKQYKVELPRAPARSTALSSSDTSFCNLLALSHFDSSALAVDPNDKKMRLTCILAVLVAVTFHATGNANSAVAGKASNEYGVDMITTTDVHDPRLLRVGNDEGEIVEERTKGFKEKLKAVVEKITPRKAWTNSRRLS